MPGIQVLPRNYNPWTQALPGFLQQMVFTNMSQKFQKSQAEERRKFAAEELAEKRKLDSEALTEKRAYEKDLTKESREFVTLEREARQRERLEFEIKKNPSLKLIRGKHFFHLYNDRNGNVTPTKVPVGDPAGGGYDEKKKFADYKHGLAKELINLRQKYKGAPKTMSPESRRLLDKDLATMAMTIESTPDDPAIKQATVFFNKYAMGDTVYLWKKEKGAIWGESEKAERIRLPVKNGKQITAQDIRDTLVANKDKTLEDVLKHIGATE